MDTQDELIKTMAKDDIEFLEREGFYDGKDLTEWIVETIYHDLGDRSGIKEVLGSLEDEIKEDMKKLWCEEIRLLINKALQEPIAKS